MDVDRKWPAAGPLLEEDAVAEAEDAAPEPVDVHRQHGDIDPIDNLDQAALKWLNLAGAGESPLGEDTDARPFTQGGLGELERLDQGLGAFGVVDGDRAEEIGNPPSDPFLDVAGERDKPDVSGEKVGEEEAVDPGDVIGGEHASARAGQVLQPMHADAIDVSQEQAKQHPDPVLGKKPPDVGGHRKGRDTAQQKDLPGGESQGFLEEVVQAGDREDAAEGQEIARGENLAAFLGRAAVLQERIERHIEETRAGSQQEQQGFGPAPGRGDRLRLRGIDTRRDEEERGGENHDSCRGEGHKPQFHATTRPPTRQDAPRPDPQDDDSEQFP